jgi:membrane protease YdiL (CAAX protease family)
MKQNTELFYHKVVRLLFAFALILFWVMGVSYVYKLIGLQNGDTYYVSLYTAIVALILAPVIEEILFRWLPWQVLAKNKGSDIQLAVVFGSSVIFGLMHGGPFSVPIQGVCGLMLFWVYIRNKSLGWSIALHVMWNFWVLFGYKIWVI